MKVYLDNASSTPLCGEAREALDAHFDAHHANPSALHRSGIEAREALEASRESVAALLNADAREIVFTSGATEANNLALRGAVTPKLIAGEKVHAVTTSIEHASVLETLKDIETRFAHFDLTVVDPKGGCTVRAEDILAAVRPDTAIVSVMAVNNEVGSVQPIEEIAAGLKTLNRPVLFHTDAVQGVVSRDIDVKKLSGVDLLTLSGHKIGAPKGIGALYVKRGIILSPVITGGGHEFGLRSGTENASGIAALGAAARRLSSKRGTDIEWYRALRNTVRGAIRRRKLDARPLFDDDDRIAPNILSLECPGQTAEMLVLRLSREGVMAASGSACKSGDRDASPVLLAMGVPKERARGVIRLSFGPQNTEKDAEDLVGVLAKVLSA